MPSVKLLLLESRCIFETFGHCNNWQYRVVSWCGHYSSVQQQLQPKLNHWTFSKSTYFFCSLFIYFQLNKMLKWVIKVCCCKVHCELIKSWYSSNDCWPTDYVRNSGAFKRDAINVDFVDVTMALLYRDRTQWEPIVFDENFQRETKKPLH